MALELYSEHLLAKGLNSYCIAKASIRYVSHKHELSPGEAIGQFVECLASYEEVPLLTVPILLEAGLDTKRIRLSRLFSWADTPQGYDFWKEVSRVYEALYNTLKGRGYLDDRH